MVSSSLAFPSKAPSWLVLATSKKYEVSADNRAPYEAVDSQSRTARYTTQKEGQNAPYTMVQYSSDVAPDRGPPLSD